MSARTSASDDTASRRSSKAARTTRQGVLQIIDADSLVIQFGEALEEREFLFEKTEADMRHSIEEQKLDLREGLLRALMAEYDDTQSAAPKDDDVLFDYNPTADRMVSASPAPPETRVSPTSCCSSNATRGRRPPADEWTHSRHGHETGALDCPRGGRPTEVTGGIPTTCVEDERRRPLLRRLVQEGQRRPIQAHAETVREPFRRGHRVDVNPAVVGVDVNFREDYLRRLHKMLRHYHEYGDGENGSVS